MFNLIYGIICMHDDAKHSKQSKLRLSWQICSNVCIMYTQSKQLQIDSKTIYCCLIIYQLFTLKIALHSHLSIGLDYANQREQSTKSNEMLNLHCLNVLSTHLLCYVSHCLFSFHLFMLHGHEHVFCASICTITHKNT